MNIFFTGAVRAGRAHQREYAYIVAELEKKGIVLSAHVSDEELSESGETELRAADILTRELESLARADVVVAEVTTPSLGVGYLIACATGMNKPVVALFRGDDTLRLSSIIKGDAKTRTCVYKTEQEIGTVLAEVFATRFSPC